MPRHDGNTRNKKPRKNRKKLTPVVEEPEPSKEEPVTQTPNDANKKRPSVGSGIFTGQLTREEEAHSAQVRRKFEKALQGAAGWRSDPANVERYKKIRERVTEKGLKNRPE